MTSSKCNVWRRPITNTVRPCLAYTPIVRRESTGWRWSIMCDTERLATGLTNTKLEAAAAVREWKKNAP